MLSAANLIPNSMEWKKKDIAREKQNNLKKKLAAHKIYPLAFKGSCSYLEFSDQVSVYIILHLSLALTHAREKFKSVRLRSYKYNIPQCHYYSVEFAQNMKYAVRWSFDNIVILAFGKVFAVSVLDNSLSNRVSTVYITDLYQ